MIIGLITGIGIIGGLICFIKFLFDSEISWSGKLVGITYTEIGTWGVYFLLSLVYPDPHIFKYILSFGIVGWIMIIVSIMGEWSTCDVFVYSRIKFEKFMAGLMIAIFNPLTIWFLLDLLGGI